MKQGSLTVITVTMTAAEIRRKGAALFGTQICVPNVCQLGETALK